MYLTKNNINDYAGKTLDAVGLGPNTKNYPLKIVRMSRGGAYFAQNAIGMWLVPPKEEGERHDALPFNIVDGVRIKEGDDG